MVQGVSCYEKKLAFVMFKELHLVLESTLEPKTRSVRKNLENQTQNRKKSKSVLRPDPEPSENLSGF